jgi:transmembrane sensor
MRRFVSGEARAADLASLQQWCARSPAHRETFECVSRAWQQLAPVGKALRSVRTTAVRSHSSRIARRAVLGGALAASAAGAAALLVHSPLELWPSWSQLAADYRTEPGEQRQVTLSDAVSIDLNTRTSINLHPRGGQGAQIELITGEAIISATSETAGLVAVVAADGRIAATHARFNVRYDQDQTVCVTCLEG